MSSYSYANYIDIEVQEKEDSNIQILTAEINDKLKECEFKKSRVVCDSFKYIDERKKTNSYSKPSTYSLEALTSVSIIPVSINNSRFCTKSFNHFSINKEVCDGVLLRQSVGINRENLIYAGSILILSKNMNGVSVDPETLAKRIRLAFQKPIPFESIHLQKVRYGKKIYKIPEAFNESYSVVRGVNISNNKFTVSELGLTNLEGVELQTLNKSVQISLAEITLTFGYDIYSYDTMSFGDTAPYIATEQHKIPFF